jgi:hypothetical protein
VPKNGDVNPYGVAFVPQNFPSGGKLQPGDILVSNFNDSANVQGTGTTIIRISPDGQHSVFFQGPTGLGLNTALGILPQGFVLVGNTPSTVQNMTPTVQDGSLLFLDSNGRVVGQLTDSSLLQGPWDLTINNQGPNSAQVFVSNVLSGTVTRIDLSIPTGGTPQVVSETRIASGYKHVTDPTALVIGPTGLAFDPRTGTLFVASTEDNAIFAIPNAARSTGGVGTGTLVTNDKAHLHGPLGLILAPNGDLIAANGDAVNPDTHHINELVEFTTAGGFVGQFQLDPGPASGAGFGLAAQSLGHQVRLAAVDDNTNAVNIFTIDPAPAPPSAAPSAPSMPMQDNMPMMGMPMMATTVSTPSMSATTMSSGSPMNMLAAFDQMFMNFEVELQQLFMLEMNFFDMVVTDIARSMMMGSAMNRMA